MLSVVTITFNNFDELVKTVSSVSGISGIELVVINGGSCAKTKSYIDKLDLPGIKVVRVSERDRGISDAFNKGIRQSTGEAVVFLNSGDTLLDKNYFQRAMDYLKIHPEIGFTHGSVVFEDRIAGDIELKPSLSSLGRGMPYRHQTMIVRKKIYDELGFFREDLKVTMDYDFVCRMHKAAVQGWYDRTGPLMKMDGSGVSSTKELQAYGEVWGILWKYGLLTPQNFYGSLVRYGKYFARATLVALGLSGLLATLKRLKQGSAR